MFFAIIHFILLDLSKALVCAPNLLLSRANESACAKLKQYNLEKYEDLFSYY